MMFRWLLVYVFALVSAINPALSALTVNNLAGFNASSPSAAASGPYFISASAGTNSANASSLSWSHTTTSDTTALIVGGYSQRDSGVSQITAVTFNGTSLDLITSAGGPSVINVSAWILFSPPVGTYTVQVTISGGNRGVAASAANFGNVTVIDVRGGAGGATTITDPLTNTITATAEGLAVANVGIRGNFSTTIDVSASAPTGMTVAHTANTWISSSNARYQALFYSPTLVSARSVDLTADVTAGSIAGRAQVFFVLR